MYYAQIEKTFIVWIIFPGDPQFTPRRRRKIHFCPGTQTASAIPQNRSVLPLLRWFVYLAPGSKRKKQEKSSITYSRKCPKLLPIFGRVLVYNLTHFDITAEMSFDLSRVLRLFLKTHTEMKKQRFCLFRAEFIILGRGFSQSSLFAPPLRIFDCPPFL